MKINKFVIVLILLSIIGTFMVYSQLPDEIPGHFSFSGEVDRYDSKTTILFTSLIPLGLYILMFALPKIDPKRESYLKHKKAYEIFKITIILFLILMNWMTILVSLGFDINVGMVTRIGVGALFIILGNYMGQIRHNYFLGIKTPWTLANEVVWKKTHRVGGIGFIISGLLLALTSFLDGPIAMVIFVISLIIAVAYPIVYSYLEYKKQTNIKR